MLRASAQQVAAATTSALQHQLMNMQKQMLASMQNPGAIQAFPEDNQRMAENFMGRVPDHLFKRSSVGSDDSLLGLKAQKELLEAGSLRGSGR